MRINVFCYFVTLIKKIMKKANFLAVVILLFAGVSCNPSKTLVDTSCSGYRGNNFDRTKILESGLGILPVLGGNDKEEFRRPMGESLYRHFSMEFGSQNIRSTQEVIKIVNDQNLAEEYLRALENYQQTGIIPVNLIRNIGKALDVRYLLFTKLLSKTELSMVYDGYSYGYVNTDELFIQTQVWCTIEGDVVWEGKGGVAHLIYNPVNMIDLTAKGLVNVIGIEPNTGPCEEPSYLVKSYQQAITKTYLVTLLATTTILSLLYLFL